ncbi:MAG: choice-of-anchor L domain-containing protein [Saprospiraceae bacterium]
MKKILTIVFLFTAIGIGFAQPVNDDIAGAVTIPLPFPVSVSGTTVNATPTTIPFIVSPPGAIPTPGTIPPNWGTAPQRDVWYTFTTPTGNPISITLNISADASCGLAAFQPKYTLYKGVVGALFAIQNVTPGSPTLASGVSGTNIISEDIIDLDPNTDYYIRVDNGVTAATGCDFTLDISEYCAPVNMPLIGGGTSTFCNNACLLYDSGGPAGNYGPNENATWTVGAPNSPGCLLLTFTNYDIDCLGDRLRIFDGQSTNINDLVTTVRGSGSTLVVEVPSGQATLQFQSIAASSGGIGWAMSWECTSQPCTPVTISDCNSATPVPSLPFTGNYSTCDAGNNYDATDACGSAYMNGEDYTFAYTSPGNECISATLTNTGIGTGLFIMDGCPNADATNCIASSEAIGGNPMIGSTYLQNPGTYYIVVSGEGCPTCTDFDIVIDRTGCPMVVNPNVLAADLAETIAGKNVDITNVQLNCPPGAYGIFDGGPGAVNINGGIILSTGFAIDAEGPNTLDGSINFPGQDANTPIGSPGDPQLTAAAQLGNNATVTTVDACILEFDVYAPIDLLTFKYAFMSEEYLEFIGDPNDNTPDYNDVFAFWIRGPGILDGSTDSLISSLPGTTTPITVSTVNPSSPASSYYVNNPAGEIGTAYDGGTILLTASAPVIPCNTYHLRMAIADGLDQFFDSGVLIEEGSLFNQGVELEIAGATVGNALSCAENCLDGTITISLVAPQTDTTFVPLDIQGSAINGVDYQTIPDTLVFPPGVISITVPVLPVADGIVEPTENIVIFLYDQCSDTIPSDSAIIFIQDDINGLFSTRDTFICGNPVALPMDGPEDMYYIWNPAESLDDSTKRNPIANPAQNTTYTVYAGNGICYDTLTVDVIVATMETPEDTIICSPGEQVLLYAVTNQTNATWTWTPDENLSSTNTVSTIATPTTTTTYSVEVVTPVCTINEDITITVFEGAAVVAADQTICEGQESVQIGADPVDGLTYLWTPADGLDDPTISNPTASPSTTTAYTLTVTGGNCSNSNTTTVSVFAPFDLAAIPSEQLFQGETTDVSTLATPVAGAISSVGTVSYVWTPTTGLSNINSAQATAGPLETTTYTVTGTNPAGCETSTAFTITVIPPVYGFPNAFTPGGSNNTTFKPEIYGNITLESFQIFNRWGQLVYDNTDPAQGWDGTINGEDAPQDTYVFAATLVLPTGEVVTEQRELLLVR